MNFNEKLISEFMALGCEDRKDAVVVLQVYLELCEVKKYWNVECKYHNDLKLLYLTASKTKSERPSIFVPESSNDNLSYIKLQSYFTLCDDIGYKRIYLVPVTSDSTCVYYQLTEGLFEPTDVNNKQSKSDRQERLDAEIRKNKRVLEEAALSSIAVTIKESKCSK
ncbi:tRNA-splicing endonuclease subunit Sen15-like [Asbolus verrucosus]|uniref:tRNA-splicing endonuclease subunit Sen15-like n=1 Tax=Asbolus verrucosus TaxID=1661398 RepID=A0A482W4B6_ASBVE|nr:tRNA-splicing endonuclease subunit Sen15-like [Asbolus verrucosus]